MIYVTDYKRPHGRFQFSVLIADTTVELLHVLPQLKLSAKWISFKGTSRECIEVSQSKKKIAIKLGAKLIGREEVEELFNVKIHNHAKRIDYRNGKAAAAGEEHDV